MIIYPIQSTGFTLLDTQTASNSAAISFSNLLTSTYDTYIAYLEGVMPATDDARLYAQFGTGATPTWQTTGYGGGGSWYRSGTVTNYSNSGSGISMVDTTTYGLDTGTVNNSLNGYLILLNPSNSNIPTHWEISCSYKDNSGGHAPSSQYAVGMYGSTTAITSLRFLMDTGNVEQGTVRLFAM